MSSDWSPGRLAELDALRGLAALAVVFYHLTTVHLRDTGFRGQPSLDIWWGDNGVELFFVISGFVIFMTLDRTKRPLDFVASRFSRLYPAYWAAVLLTTATVAALGFDQYQRTGGEVLVNLTMFQRLPGLDVRDVDWSYWSLYTEMIFYCVMLILFVTRQLKHIELYLVLALLVTVAYDVAWSFAQGQLPASSIIRQGLGSFIEVVPYAPLFVVGICLYRIWTGARRWAAFGLLAAAIAIIRATMSDEQVVAALIAVAAFGLILTGRARFLRLPPLIWLGGISYSLYLIHNVAGRAVIVRLEAAGWPADAAIAAAFMLGLAAATAINRAVERPAQAMLRSRYKRYTDALQPSGFAEAGEAEPAK
jgi:peptidoglycan/LPS O-acetylase OafA/YrhL